MKRIILGIALMAIGVTCAQAQDYDDIYYNPKKERKTEQKKVSRPSNYIEDFGSVDVDEYNRRGQYYATPVDTIGSGTENDEDFVYTQKIQKFYNPTIVVDNADVLADVLYNSYGNVDIVFDMGYPTFASVYGWPGYYNPYYCNPGWSWGWNSSWIWGPSWSWNWRPGFGWGWDPVYAWGWGPGYGWGWGPSYGWGWGGPAWGGHHHYADWNPNGHRPNRPGDNWASNTRPGGNAAMRPIGNTSNRRPGSTTASNGFYGGSNTNHHRTFGGTTTSADRVAGSGTSTTNRYSVGNDGHRRYSGSNSSTVNSGAYTNSHRGAGTSTNRQSYGSGSINNYNSGSSNRSSYSSGRSSSGSGYNSSRSYSSPGRSSGGASHGGGGGGRGGRR